MTEPKSFLLSAELHRYLLDHSTDLDERQRALVEETAELGGVSVMQVAPEQGLLLTMLTRLVGANLVVEVGTFTGLSAMCFAFGLDTGGSVITCDVSDEWTAIARAAWERAGVSDRIELRLGPAADTLRAMPTDPVIDLAFIDADKPNYRTYYDELLPRLRSGGLLLADNVLWSGAVVDPAVDDENVRAIRDFNDYVAADGRVEVVMLPVSDGLSLVRKR
jgi:caffeoyl-CoA O-methyltransferase